MSAEFIPEILEVRISREELRTLHALGVGLSDIVRVLGANVETRAAIFTLLSIVNRAERSYEPNHN